jgi:glycosyltransferase involved in cell wall biosynthesis
MQIVQGVLSLDLGGLERLVLDLVRNFCAKGHRVSVVCVERPGRLATEVERAGAEVYSLEKPAGRSTEAVQRATELLQKLDPDVVHTHQIGALWYLGRAAARIGLESVVHTEHSDHVRMARGLWNQWKTRWRWRINAKLAKRFCCVSDDIARSARRWGTVPSSKVRTVLNGIDTTIGDHCMHRESIRQPL